MSFVVKSGLSSPKENMSFMWLVTNHFYGWVRVYKPTSLMDAISMTRDMIDAVRRTLAFVPTRPIVPLGTTP